MNIKDLTMKNTSKLTALIVCLFMAVSISAQKRIQASQIIQDVKKGKKITYKNATIVGVLDFTFMEEKIDKLPKRKKSSWWKNVSKDNKIEEMIKSNVSFENCTFEDDVYAYIHDEDSGYTFVASFTEDVVFKNCTFKERAYFKYSDFEETADFSNSKFQGDSTFKYAKFMSDVSFKSTTYREASTFKYAKFSNKVSFANAVFNESATFKYTQFKDGVSFNKTRFEQDLDIKYTKVYGDFDIAGMHVEYDVNSKYTQVNGRKFSYHQN
jgi:translation elongation factor P/translation initiation factor 5A